MAAGNHITNHTAGRVKDPYITMSNRLTNRTYTAIGLVLVVVSIWALFNMMPRVCMTAFVGSVLTIVCQGKNEKPAKRKR